MIKNNISIKGHEQSAQLNILELNIISIVIELIVCSVIDWSN